MTPLDITNPITYGVLYPPKGKIYYSLSKMLDIQFPMYLDALDVDFEKFRATFKVAYHPKAPFCCPNCGEKDLKVQSHHLRNIKSLDFLNFETYIKLNHPNVKCPNCAIKAIDLGFVEYRSNISKSLKRRILDLTSIMSLTSVAKLTKISYDRIHVSVNKVIDKTKKK
jgi:transposase